MATAKKEIEKKTNYGWTLELKHRGGEGKCFSYKNEQSLS